MGEKREENFVSWNDVEFEIDIRYGIRFGFWIRILVINMELI